MSTQQELSEADLTELAEIRRQADLQVRQALSTGVIQGNSIPSGDIAIARHFLRKGYREGIEASAKVCDGHAITNAEPSDDYAAGQNDAVCEIATDIRALKDRHE